VNLQTKENKQTREAVGHFVALPRRLTAIGGSKLTGCVYSLLTSIRLELSSLLELLLSFTVYDEPLPEEMTRPTSLSLFPSLSFQFSLNLCSKHMKEGMPRSMELQISKKVAII
jgi:hypothetical protein